MINGKHLKNMFLCPGLMSPVVNWNTTYSRLIDVTHKSKKGHTLPVTCNDPQRKLGCRHKLNELECAKKPVPKPSLKIEGKTALKIVAFASYFSGLRIKLEEG